MYVAPKVVN